MTELKGVPDMTIQMGAAMLFALIGAGLGCLSHSVYRAIVRFRGYTAVK